MAERSQLARNWVEVQEAGDASRIVLRPIEYPVPPLRSGRRQLQLAPAGGVRSLGAGAADAMEVKGRGGWSVDGDALNLDLEGWEGRYRIEELNDEILVLRRQ